MVHQEFKVHQEESGGGTGTGDAGFGSPVALHNNSKAAQALRVDETRVKDEFETWISIRLTKSCILLSIPLTKIRTRKIPAVTKIPALTKHLLQEQVHLLLSLN